ncbi:hypothetical protein CPC08DRAFT_711208 [Agrocybe pediades]|nr:hypothetical protein CPC08DRAFT_711208 [Agrocybe pediades]
MPGKHVHFSEDYMPSPSFSVSTLPSSSGVATPPSLGPGSPYHFTPLPGTAIAHPVVTSKHRYFIPYDLSQSVDDVQSLARYARLPDFVWEEPATQPPTNYMDVRCTRLPWRTIIQPGSGRPYVTLKDLVEQLHRSLQRGVMAGEFEPLPSTMQTRISEAFIFRCKQMPESERRAEHAQGLKRLDFLMGHTTMVGVVSGKEGPNTWMLLVS